MKKKHYNALRLLWKNIMMSERFSLKTVLNKNGKLPRVKYGTETYQYKCNMDTTFGYDYEIQIRFIVRRVDG